MDFMENEDFLQYSPQTTTPIFEFFVLADGLCSREPMGRLVRLVQPSNFTYRRNQVVFMAMKNMYLTTGDRINPTTVNEELRRLGMWDESMPDFLSSLEDEGFDKIAEIEARDLASEKVA
jgi:replicative DNA helicase